MSNQLPLNSVSKLLLAGSIFIVVLVLTIAAGGVDFLAHDGDVDIVVAYSVLVYWLLLCIGVLLVLNVRRRPRELLLVVISVLVAIASVELGIRYTRPKLAMLKYYSRSSIKYHHVYPPNVEMYSGIYDGKKVVVTTNEDGLRTRYSRAEFLRHKNRIVVLGDSFTFGWGVRQKAAFPQMIEKIMKSRPSEDDVAVLNTGVVSYSPILEERAYFGKLRAYKPDVVLLVLDATDIGDDIEYARELTTDDSASYFRSATAPPKFRDYGALYNLVYPYIKAALRYPYNALQWRLGGKGYDYYDFHLVVDGVEESNRFFTYRHPLESTRQYFLKSLSYINHIAADVSDSGGKFILVVTPRFQHWNPKESSNNWEKFAYKLNEPYQYEYFRFFDEIKGQVNFDILNMLPVFQASKQFPLCFDNDPHWNESGHALVANALVDYLVKKRVIH